MQVGLSGYFWQMDTTGSGQYLHQLLAALPAAAPHLACRLFLPGRAEGADASVAAQHVPTPFGGRAENLGKLCFEQWALPRAARRAGMDLLHVPYFAPPLAAGLPVVVTVHDLIPLILPAYRGGPGVRAYMRLAARAARRADVVITDSRASGRDLRRVLGIAANRLRVIPLAAGPECRPPDAAELAAGRARLGLPEGPYLLYLGGFDQRKNVPLLLAAYAQVRPQLGDVPLVVAGRLPAHDSAFAPDPRLIAARLGLGPEAVRYTGHVAEADKAIIYGGAVAFVFPSALRGLWAAAAGGRLVRHAGRRGRRQFARGGGRSRRPGGAAGRRRCPGRGPGPPGAGADAAGRSGRRRPGPCGGLYLGAHRRRDRGGLRIGSAAGHPQTIRKEIVMSATDAEKTTDNARRDWRSTGATLALGAVTGAYLSRMVAEETAGPWRALPLAGLAAVALAIGLALSAWAGRRRFCRWPLALMAVYVVWPWPWPLLGVGAAVGAAALLVRLNWRWSMAALWPEAAVVAGALGLYIATLAPGVLPADSGEFQLAGAVLGIAHPPGYSPVHHAGPALYPHPRGQRRLSHQSLWRPVRRVDVGGDHPHGAPRHGFHRGGPGGGCHAGAERHLLGAEHHG